jgi:hypothetical protein
MLINYKLIRSMNIFKFLRTTKSPFNNEMLINTIRGAKRKGEKKEIVHSQHVLNVFKRTKEDVKILPDEYYPPWVLDLWKWPTSKEDMFGMFFVGNYVCIYLF